MYLYSMLYSGTGTCLHIYMLYYLLISATYFKEATCMHGLCTVRYSTVCFIYLVSPYTYTICILEKRFERLGSIVVNDLSGNH